MLALVGRVFRYTFPIACVLPFKGFVVYYLLGGFVEW